MKKQISRSQLTAMYNEGNVTELAERLDMSLAGLYKLLDSAGIERKKPEIANRRKRTAYEIVE